MHCCGIRSLCTSWGAGPQHSLSCPCISRRFVLFCTALASPSSLVRKVQACRYHVMRRCTLHTL